MLFIWVGNSNKEKSITGLIPHNFLKFPPKCKLRLPKKIRIAPCYFVFMKELLKRRLLFLAITFSH